MITENSHNIIPLNSLFNLYEFINQIKIMTLIQPIYFLNFPKVNKPKFLNIHIPIIKALLHSRYRYILPIGINILTIAKNSIVELIQYDLIKGISLQTILENSVLNRCIHRKFSLSCNRYTNCCCFGKCIK